MIKPAEKKEDDAALKKALEQAKRQSDFWALFADKQDLEYKKPNVAVVEALPLFRKRGVEKIIDIGCGNARNSFLLGNEGFNVFALDSSPKVIEFVKDRVKRDEIKNVRPILGDATDIRYSDGYFDAAVNHRVLDICKKGDSKKIVDEMERVLKPGGIAVVSMASIDSKIYRTKLDGLGKETAPETISYETLSLHFFSEQEIRKLFKNFNTISLEERLSTDNQNKFWVLLAEKKK